MRHPQRIGTAGNSFFLPTCDTSRISIGRNKQVAFMMQTRGGGWAQHLNVIRLMKQVVIITCEQTPFQWNTTLNWGRPDRRLWSHCYCVTCRIKWRSKRGNGPSSLVVSAPMSVTTLRKVSQPGRDTQFADSVTQGLASWRGITYLPMILTRIESNVPD